MKVAERLAGREADWAELQGLLDRFEGRSAKVGPKPGPIASGDVVRLGELYRSACADLMLAEAHDLPRETVAFLHALVGRAHNVVYRSTGFRLSEWSRAIFEEVPRRLRADPMLRASALVFWGLFLLLAFASASRPGFAASILGRAAIEGAEAMYERPLDGSSKIERDDSAMTGFYIFNNAGIGLRTYAFGLLFGVGSLFILATNAIGIGLIFGHMATVPQAANFFTFVTAHGPFELTAIVFSGAAGLRLGSGLIVTRGLSRLASLRREARASVPIVGVAVLLFVFAAFIEGFVSASPLPYWVKAGIALASSSLLVFYLFGLGRGADRP